MTADEVLKIADEIIANGNRFDVAMVIVDIDHRGFNRGIECALNLITLPAVKVPRDEDLNE